MNPYEAIAEGICIHGLPGCEVDLVVDALGRAGLRTAERHLSRSPHEVSGGQRQRVLIAGAMVLSPQPSLANEPHGVARRLSGCRFHLRCPVVRSGEAASLGILDRAPASTLR